MFLIGVIGICGLFSENRCLLSIYFTLLFILVGLEISGVVLVIVYQHTVKVFVKDLFTGVLENYGTMNETRMSQNFDYIQYKVRFFKKSFRKYIKTIKPCFYYQVAMLW